MTPGDSAAPIYRDTRDFTPFGQVRFRTPVTELAGSLGGLVQGVLGGRDHALMAVDGVIPRLKLRPGKAAKAVHDAIFSSREPGTLLMIARAYPGWAGLCYVMAGLLAYQHGRYPYAVELLQRGLATRNDDEANQYAFAYLSRVVTRVEVADRIEVPVLFSQESVFLALSHAQRETGELEAALGTLAGLPPSLPAALARCALAFSLGRDKEVVIWTEDLLNSDDLAAALLLLRARALRRLGAKTKADRALSEVLRRRKTHIMLRNDALSDRALLLLDNGRKTLNPRDWLRGKTPESEIEIIRKDVEERRLWEQDWKKLHGE